MSRWSVRSCWLALALDLLSSRTSVPSGKRRTRVALSYCTGHFGRLRKRACGLHRLGPSLEGRARIVVLSLRRLGRWWGSACSSPAVARGRRRLERKSALALAPGFNPDVGRHGRVRMQEVTGARDWCLHDVASSKRIRTLGRHFEGHQLRHRASARTCRLPLEPKSVLEAVLAGGMPRWRDSCERLVRVAGSARGTACARKTSALLCRCSCGGGSRRCASTISVAGKP